MGKKALVIRTKDLLSEVIPKANMIQMTEDRQVFKLENTPLLSLPTHLADRDFCETDISLLQLLPYVALCHLDAGVPKYFVYQRGKGGNESRLHANFSVGVGGHMEEEVSGNATLRDAIVDCALREIKEEVGIDVELYKVSAALDQATIIYDRSNDVGKVHLGIAMTVFLGSTDLGQLEAGVLENGEWLTVESLRTYNLENWSAIYMNK